MKTKQIFFSAVAAAFLLSACQENQAETEEEADQVENNEENPADPSAEPGTTIQNPAELTSELLPNQAAETIAFTYVLTNETNKAQTLTFPSGQRFDFQVQNKQGDIMYTWSQNKTFIMAQGEETIEPAEKLSYDLTIDETLEPGTYTIAAWLTTDTDQDLYRQTASFTVE